MDTPQIIADIKLEFLSLLRDNKSGYFITLEKLYTWLENPQTHTNYICDENYRRNFRKRYLRNDKLLLDESNDEQDLDKDFIMRKTNGINMPWFSNEGFKTFCMVVNEPKSNYVRKYFIQIEKDYMRVLEQSAEATVAELQALNTDLCKAKQSIIKISTAAEQTLEQHLALQYKLQMTATLEVILDEQEDFCSVGNNEYKEYLYLRELHMKRIPIYIVKKETMEVVSKTISKIADTDSESDFVQMVTKIKPTKVKKTRSKKVLQIDTDVHYKKNYDEYNFANDINIDKNSGEMSPVLYYYIGGYNEKVEKNTDTHFKICNLHILDKEHLEEIKNQLSIFNKCSKRWIYKTTYSEIIDIALEISNSRFRDLLITKRV